MNKFPILEALGHHAQVGVYATDARGCAHYLSPLACRIIGLPCRQALGHGWLAALHPDDRRRVLRGRNRAIARGGVFRSRFRFMRAGGEVVWAHAVTVPRRDARGRIAERVGMLFDVTDLHERRGPAFPQDDPLSPQERRIVRLVADGRTNKEIARILSLSDKTVKNYLSSAFQKLHVTRRSQAAAVFARRTADP